MRKISAYVCGVIVLSLTPALAASKLDFGKKDKPTPASHSVSSLRLRFANTDVSDVLQAIEMRTRANIVFPAQMKRLVSLDITAYSVNEAISYAAAAAGLAFRRIGRTFIVGLPEELRQLLEPFGMRATIPLTAMTADDAVKLVTGALPYVTVRPAGNQILVIGAPEDLRQARQILADQEQASPPDPVAQDVVVLEHTPASQVVTVLKSMFPSLKAEAVGQQDKIGGAIGFVGPRSQVESARETLHKLDVPAPAASPRVFRIYNIRYSSAPALMEFLRKTTPTINAVVAPEHYSPSAPGFNPISNTGSSGSGGSSGGTSSGGGGTGGGSGGGGSDTGAAGGDASASTGAGKKAAAERAKMLVLSGDSTEVEGAVKLLAQVDIAPQQILVEVKVVDTSPEVAKNLGMTWSWNPLQFMEYPVGTGLTGDHTDAKQPYTVPIRPGYFSKVPLSIAGVLNAMMTSKESKLLADPRIQVLDNDDASIFIGDTYRTQVSQVSVTGTTIQIVEFPVGIILLVRPRVNADGDITMRVHPVISTVTNIGGNNLPQTNSREAETTVRIKDGETMVIGGLIQDEMSKTVQEVPILSKLPIIGELFRNRTTDHRHTEIMVFITPHIIKEGAGVALAPTPAKSESKGGSHG